MNGWKRMFLSHCPNQKNHEAAGLWHVSGPGQNSSVSGGRDADSLDGNKEVDSEGSNLNLSNDTADRGEEHVDGPGRRRDDGSLFPLWRLPEDVLLHVLSFLKLNDRLQASSVCRRWRRLVFSTPRLWRRRHFTLRCSRHSRHGRWACCYLRQLGRYLHKLTVTCEQPRTHNCRSMAVSFRKLLVSLKNPPVLNSFKVTDLKLPPIRASVLASMTSALEQLLNSLPRLKSFQMSNAYWPQKEGLVVMKALLAASTSTLHTLRMDGFFAPRTVRSTSEAADVLTGGLRALTCLTKLSIDYFYLSEQSVLALAASRNDQLRLLKLVAHDVSPDSHFVSRLAWQSLTRACPSLRVSFCVHGFTVSPARSLPLLLCADLRVSRIKLSIGNSYTFLDMPRLNTAAVLNHVTRHFRRRLVRFEMDIDNHNDSLDAALIKMVRRCRNLVSVKVTAYFTSPDTDRIVRDLVRRRRDKDYTNTLGPGPSSAIGQTQREQTTDRERGGQNRNQPGSVTGEEVGQATEDSIHLAGSNPSLGPPIGSGWRLNSSGQNGSTADARRMPAAGYSSSVGSSAAAAATSADVTVAAVDVSIAAAQGSGSSSQGEDRGETVRVTFPRLLAGGSYSVSSAIEDDHVITMTEDHQGN